MDRTKILALIDVQVSRGLEIGALANPIVPREQGMIEYIDRASTDELRRWYANNPQVDLAKLVEVDHVWGAETLFECVGRRRVYDYVIASHVIEHVPDLFGWLREIASVLVDDGIASFVVPDKRYTFDILRRTSSDSEFVDAFVRKLRRPDPRQIFDHFSLFRNVDMAEVRSGRISPATLPAQHQPLEVLELCQRTLVSGEYIDSHCWVFTPKSFVNALDLASRLGLLPFQMAALFPTSENSHEFFVSLRRTPETASAEDQRAAFVDSVQRLDLPSEDDASQNNADLAQRVMDAEQALQALRDSRSWRLTAPLRHLATLYRKLRSGQRC